MNWHTRYAQQANWTRDLRNHIFEKAGLKGAHRVLEVGCGTGAILSEMPDPRNIYGLDIQHDSLVECRLHAPAAYLTEGDAAELPYLNNSFDIVYCHFLLLWVRDPLQALREMRRVTRGGGYILAFAEPNYLERIDKPDELYLLGKWQIEALRRQGADPGIGARLAELFFEAEINLIETGTLQRQGNERSAKEMQIEWDVIESDLKGWISDQELQTMKQIDLQARDQKRRVLHIPTYFAWGRV